MREERGLDKNSVCFCVRASFRMIERKREREQMRNWQTEKELEGEGGTQRHE